MKNKLGILTMLLFSPLMVIGCNGGDSSSKESGTSSESSTSSEPSTSESSSTTETPVLTGEGYTVTFEMTHCNVLVYYTQDYDGEKPLDVDVTETRDVDNNCFSKYVAEDLEHDIEEVKPQVNFKVVCDEGYTVGLTNIAITGEYKNLKDCTNGIYRATVIKSDLTIKIDATQDTPVDDMANGHKITFVTDHCKVLAYMTKTFSEETPVEVTEFASRDYDTGLFAKWAAADETAGTPEIKPQVNFKVVADEGYVVTVDEISISGTKGQEWNKLELSDDKYPDIFKITKIKADIVVTITASLIA